MNRGLFTGWRDVFAFTFKQNVQAKGFKLATLGLAVLFFVGGMAISVIMAFVQQRNATEVSPIEVVHIINDSGLENLYLDGFLEANKERYPSLSFVTETDRVENINQSILDKAQGTEEGSGDVILQVNETENGYLLTLYLPQTSVVSEGQGNDFLEDALGIMQQSKLMSSGIAMEKLVYAMSSVSSTVLDAGEDEKSLGEELVSMFLPMICIFFIYIMILVYGTSIGNIVSVEKTSKLMEMMLTMTRPYALIFGKILAATSIAILQMFLWVVSLVAGFFTGDATAQIIYPEYNNILIEVFDLLSSKEGSSAFSIGAIVLGLITICLSFLFYCVLAGMIASFADKAETLAQVMAYYQMIMVAGFAGAYMLPLQEKDWINNLLRIIPITSAYLLPGDVVVGNVTVLEGVLYMAILLITTVVLIIFTGKIYKNQLFYRGSKLLERLKKKKA